MSCVPWVVASYVGHNVLEERRDTGHTDDELVLALQSNGFNVRRCKKEFQKLKSHASKVRYIAHALSPGSYIVWGIMNNKIVRALNGRSLGRPFHANDGALKEDIPRAEWVHVIRIDVRLDSAGCRHVHMQDVNTHGMTRGKVFSDPSLVGKYFQEVRKVYRVSPRPV